MPKLDDWLHASKRIQDSMLMPYLRDFATALLDDGYTYLSVKSKLWSLADFGQWLQKRNFPIRDFDEKLIESFIKSRRQRRGEVKTLHQFLDHLRRSNIVRNRKPPPERSPLAKILNRYEEHLQLERGLVRVTIAGYLPFVRKFLVERFRDQPFRLRKLKASDVSDFVLRHGTVANWRLSTVPKYLTPQEVQTCTERVRPADLNWPARLCCPSSACTSRTPHRRGSGSAARRYRLESGRNNDSR